MSPEAWAATEYTIAVWPTISINCSPVTAHILTDLCDHYTAQKGPSLVQNILAVGYFDIHFSHWSKYYPDSEKDQSQNSMHMSGL
jgi:hypothetical protein